MSANWSGSPAGTFNQIASGSSGVAGNVTVIGAPAAGLAIYVQSIAIDNAGLGAGANAYGAFHPAGGAVFAPLGINGAGGATQFAMVNFPGGFRLPDATALQVNIGANAISWYITYTIGPTI